MYLVFLAVWCVLHDLKESFLCAQVGQNWWLSIWSNETSRLEQQGQHIHSSKYMSVYFSLGLLSLFVQGGRALLLVLGSFNASRRLHANLLAKVMRLPMAFFDSQPTGRLLNRYRHQVLQDCACCLQHLFSNKFLFVD